MSISTGFHAQIKRASPKRSGSRNYERAWYCCVLVLNGRAIVKNRPDNTGDRIHTSAAHRAVGWWIKGSHHRWTDSKIFNLLTSRQTPILYFCRKKVQFPQQLGKKKKNSIPVQKRKLWESIRYTTFVSVGATSASLARRYWLIPVVPYAYKILMIHRVKPPWHQF